MNRILARQLRRLGLSESEVPPDLESWRALLERVEASYRDADRSRYLLERSMEVSSREMRQLADEIRELSRIEVERTQQVSRHNFNELPVAAWLEDFRPVADRLTELRQEGVEDLAAHLENRPEELRDLVGRVVVVDCNPAVCDLVGGGREELIGPVDPSLLGSESLRSWQLQFEAIWEGMGRVEVEFTGQRADGSDFSAYLQWAVPQIDGAIDYSRVMVVVIDISDRIAAEERMREIVKAKDEFLASVSHELRTPLTSVIGYADLLRTVPSGSAEQVEMIETIAQQAADLANIVEDLLVGARVDLGQLRVDAEAVEVGEVVESVLGSYPEVDWDRDMVGDIQVVADANRVRQILRNLITNAERYGGPTIGVEVGVRDGDAIIGVTDDGPPLSADIVDRIFDRYFRNRQEAGRPGSVGIGLTISRDLARLMGGDIGYRHDGTRAHFELTLPVAQEPALRAAG